MTEDERKQMRDELAFAVTAVLRAMSRSENDDMSFDDRGIIVADVALGMIEKAGYRVTKI